MFILLLLLAFNAVATCNNRRPVFFMHGIISASLIVDADVDPAVHKFPEGCPQKLNGQVWLNIKDVHPFNNTVCMFDYLSCHWNEQTKKFENIPGENVYYPDWPSTEGIQSLAPANQKVANAVLRVWYLMARKLRLDGWKDKQDMFAPAYDWRYADRTRDNWIEKTKELVKNAVESTGFKAVFVTHSYGGPMAMLTFHLMGKEFTDKYIDKVVTVASPFIGASVALKTILSGEDFGLKIDLKNVFATTRTWEGLIQLLPNKNYWQGDETVVTFNGKSYKMSDIKEILKLTGEKWFDTVYDEAMSRYPFDHVPGNVPLHCIYSDGLETERSYVYNDTFEENPKITYGDGDGTVDIQSLEWCKRPEMGAVYIKKISKVDHVSMIKNDEVIKYVKEVSCSAEPATKKYDENGERIYQ